ncbi:MAG: glycosyltransferase family 39 protein [Chloroflexi bacterium]|nr:glycosyltransferase family 39 protein [Chloroflexota bacterium]
MATRTRLAILAILLAAFALRAGNLDTQSIWGDEAFSIFTAKQDIAFVTGGGADTHPPLYHFLLHTWMLTAGRTPFAIRWLSVMASMLAVAAAYVLARQVSGRNAGAGAPLLAALLVAAAPFQVFYAQEARMYAQTAALCALSLAGFIGWHARGTRRALLGWIVATLPALYSHYFAFFVLGAQDLFLLGSLWRDRRTAPGRLRAAVVAHLALALAYLPWVNAQREYLSSRANARASTLSLQGIWDVVRQSLGALFAGTTLDGPVQVAAALFCLALALFGLWSARRAPYAWLMALAIGVPIAGAIVVNPLLPFFRERFLLLASVPFALLMAAGLWRLPTPERWVSLAVIGAIVALALSNTWYADRFHKGEYGLAINTIRSNMRAGDAVIVYTPIQEAVYDYYRIEGLPAYTMPGADLAAVAAKQSRIWLLLYGDPAVFDPNRSAEQFLSQHGFKSFYQGYRDGALARYDMASEAVTLTPAQTRFGDAVTLTGYAVPPSVARGETLPVVLQWQSSAPLSEDYTVFAHLLAPDGRVVTQMDSQPVGGTRPTRGWKPGEPVRDQIGVAVPFDAPPGVYRVEVGMYLLRTLQRLPVRESGGLPVQADAVILGSIEVR